MVNYKHYTYRVTWSEEDSEYIGLCAELPSISYLAKSPASALKGVTNLCKDILMDMDKNGEVIPDPFSEKQYSGKFVVRIPPEQHRMLALMAAEAGISLNRYISSKLNS